MSKHVCPECKSDDVHQFQSLATDHTRLRVCECRQCGWFGTPNELVKSEPEYIQHFDPS